MSASHILPGPLLEQLEARKGMLTIGYSVDATDSEYPGVWTVGYYFQPDSDDEGEEEHGSSVHTGPALHQALALLLKEVV